MIGLKAVDVEKQAATVKQRLYYMTLSHKSTMHDMGTQKLLTILGKKKRMKTIYKYYRVSALGEHLFSEWMCPFLDITLLAGSEQGSGLVLDEGKSIHRYWISLEYERSLLEKPE